MRRRPGWHDPSRRVAQHEHAHAAALGDVDDLRLGGAPEGGEAVALGAKPNTT